MAIKDVESDDNGGNSFVLFACIVFLVSSVVFVIATASSSFFPAVFELRPSVSANAAGSVVGFQKNLFIAAATNRNQGDNDRNRNRSRSLNSSDSSSSPVLFKLRNKLEKGLARARVAIRKAAAAGKSSTSDHIYRNPAAFYQSYMEMEKRFKVYIYDEGEPPMVHFGPCKNIYASEGRFIIEMEQGGGGNKFRTTDPHSAHAFFMPFSVTWMVKYLYKPDTYDLNPLQDFIFDYVKVISTKYPFWNRTQGADHFMLSCHDWGPRASQGDPYLYNTSMRVLCNANSSEGFNPRKDVSLPEVNLYDGNVSPKINSPPPLHCPRPYLAFFAGGLHGPVRPTLLRHWKGKDPDLPVYEYLPKDMDYYSFMLQSRFCLCPSGYEVASPRIVEAIYAECVPVILSDHYVLPFSDVLRWEAFSVKVEIPQIPHIKEILSAIPEDEFLKLKRGLRAARRHFVLNQPAQRFDMFHMILHSIWLRRINFIHDTNLQ